MPKNIQLRIDDPCSERWDGMSPREEGRFCFSCNKTVVDFTGMTDQEILGWFANSQGVVCGRFRGGQLQRELLPVAVPVLPRKGIKMGWWHFLLAGLLVSSKVSAQTGIANPAVSQRDSTAVNGAHSIGKVLIGGSHSLKGELPDTLQGRLISESNGEGVVTASIVIDRHHQVRTDLNGYFFIARQSLAGKNKLTIYAIGYEVREINIRKTWKNAGEKVISIKLDQHVLTGAVAIVGR